MAGESRGTLLGNRALDEDVHYHREEPAIAATPTTRLARSRRSVTRPKTITVAKRVTTPLPASSQLTRIIGASTSKPDAPVALSSRCQAIQLTSVVMPAIAKRRRKRAQGQTARTAAASTPATRADTYVTDTPYIGDPPLARTVVPPVASPLVIRVRQTYGLALVARA